jgi:hypothetical protein
MLQVLTSDNIVARCAVVRIFGSGVLHSESTRQQTIREITLTPSVAQHLEEVLLVCLETVLTLSSSDYIVSQQSPTVSGFLSEVANSDAPISSGETVIGAVALISSLLETRRPSVPSGASASSPALYDPSYSQLTDFALNSQQEVSLQTSCCRAILAVLTGMWERLSEMTNNSDTAVVHAMWAVLLSLSSGKQSAEVLLVHGVVDVMKNWIHSLTSPCPPDSLSSRDLLLSAFQILRSILIGFEESAAHLILLSDGILFDLTEYLYRETASTAHVELIIHILHCLSTTTANATQLLNISKSPLSVSTVTATDDCLDYRLVDWLCGEVIRSLSIDEREEKRPSQLQPISVSRMVCLLCNLSRVKGVSERILSNSSLLEALKRSLVSEATSSSPKRASSVDSEVSNGPLWSINDVSNSLTSPMTMVQSTSLLGVILSLLNAIAPSMYLMDSEMARQVLPLDLLPSLLFVAAESTNILHIDQVCVSS